PGERLRVGVRDLGRRTVLVGGHPVRLPSAASDEHDPTGAIGMTTDQRPVVRDAEALLEYVWETALDDDYRTGSSKPSGRSSRLLTAVTWLAFGLLIATAAAQTRLDLPASEAERA